MFIKSKSSSFSANVYEDLNAARKAWVAPKISMPLLHQ